MISKNTDLLIGSSNYNKIEEIKAILPSSIRLLSLADKGYYLDLPETGMTLEENAVQKAKKAYELFSMNCFAEDTGLEVDSLGGQPGVISARYAGEHKSTKDNIDKLLSELSDCKSRNARFRTVIALIWNENVMLFEGIIAGKITKEQDGQGGFGYDPVFIPDGFSKTFAQLPSEVKNSISHRAKALKSMIAFLEKETQRE